MCIHCTHCTCRYTLYAAVYGYAMGYIFFFHIRWECSVCANTEQLLLFIKIVAYTSNIYEFSVKKYMEKANIAYFKWKHGKIQWDMFSCMNSEQAREVKLIRTLNWNIGSLHVCALVMDDSVYNILYALNKQSCTRTRTILVVHHKITVILWSFFWSGRGGFLSTHLVRT